MSVTVLLTAQVKPNKEEEFVTLVAKCLKETRLYDGFINIEIYEDKITKGSFVFYEKWVNIKAYEAYLSWRTEQGVMDEIGAMLTTAPLINYYDLVDI